MRHVYECPLRWADLDLLGHVNNVIYVDYLQEARIDMLRVHAPDRRTDELADGLVVVRHEVQYVAPLTFRPEPVTIETWVTEIRAASFTMAYEIFDETPTGRVVYLRATTVLTPFVFATERPRRITAEERDVLERFLEDAEPVRSPKPAPIRHDPSGHYGLNVRFSDVDVYGHVNNVKYFEYFQEARISQLMRLFEGQVIGDDAPLVVAQMDVDYKVPILFRPEPYDLWSWIAHVGRSSFVVESAILDGERELSRARVAMVTFDAAAQRAAPASEAYRGVLVDAMERSLTAPAS
jgi:acyl-CoA thioester hydrolase